MKNYNTCCRLCLQSEGNFQSLLQDGKLQDELQQTILKNLEVEILADDKFTTMICSNCIEKVNNWQIFKQTCTENQSEIEQWYNAAASAAMQPQTNNDLSISIDIEIKEEPIEHMIIPPPEVVLANGDAPIMKNESIEEKFNDLPPPPTPRDESKELVSYSANDSTDTNLADQLYKELSQDSEETYDPRRCGTCSKLLSSIINRKKHEQEVHGTQSRNTLPIAGGSTDLNSSSSSLEDRSPTSVGSKCDQLGTVQLQRSSVSEENKKILFAAGLKLLQRDSAPPIASEELSRIELSYIEKCKAMHSMHTTLICACHNESHANLKGLLTHLQTLRMWFPVFTCYHCMITFTDRSTSRKHYSKCPKSNLGTLVKLSNLKKRSEVKTRLYQIFKCNDCKYLYSFHEDYCRHVDEEHSKITLPLVCSCGRQFQTEEAYKDHVYVSCLVDFYCDICFITVKTLAAFKKHAAEVHDASEGFILRQDDNYRQKKTLPAKDAKLPSVKRNFTSRKNIISKKKRTSSKSIINGDEETILKPLSIKHPGTKCPRCMREYSTNNNMLRHYRTHFNKDGSLKNEEAANSKNEEIDNSKHEEVDNSKSEDVHNSKNDNSIYRCPDCGIMFNVEEWELHKEMHKKKKCTECSKVFQFQSELEQHQSTHLNLKLYRDSKTQNYKNTMASRHGGSNNIVMMCEVCERMFTSKEELSEHKLTHDKIKPLLQSKNSDDVDRTNKKLQVPKMVEFPKRCLRCAKLFKTIGSYTNHMQMHKCIAKSRVVPTRESKRVFKQSHGINTPPPNKPKTKNTKKVWCDICHCPFENLPHLKRHKAEDHDETMPNLTAEQDQELTPPVIFTCNICDQNFTSKMTLKKHKKRHEKHVPKDDFKCKTCSKIFNSFTALSTHQGWHKRVRPENNKLADQIKITTIEEEPIEPKAFKCDKCSVLFPNETALQIHVTEKHRHIDTTIMMSRCSMCNLDFGSLQEYEQHKRFHAMVERQPKKAFSCNQCPSVFSKNEALKTHTRQFHTKTKNFKCLYCDRVFDKHNSLSIHLKVHENQKLVTGTVSRKVTPPPPVLLQPTSKKFTCSICNKSFDIPKELRTHTMEAHPF